MKKSMIMVLILVIALSSILYVSANETIEVEVNGKQIHFNDMGPIEKDGEVFIPVATIATYLGIDYEWISESQSIKFSKDGVEISLKVGDYNSFIQNDRTYVSLKFISETFGSVVTMDKNLISISTANLREEIHINETKLIETFKKENFMDYASPNANKYPMYSYIEDDYIKYDKIQTVSFGSVNDFPIQIGEYTILSMELGQRKGVDYIIIKQRIPHQSTNGLPLTIADKNWTTFRSRNSIENFSEVVTDDNTCITYYPVMSLNDRTFEGLNYLNYKLPNEFYIILNSLNNPNAFVLEGNGGTIK